MSDNHVIKKSDVDGDVMGQTLKRLECDIEYVENYRQGNETIGGGEPDFCLTVNDLKLLRNVLIAQSVPLPSPDEIILELQKGGVDIAGKADCEEAKRILARILNYKPKTVGEERSDVDGDVMEALDDFRQFLEYEWHGTAYCKGSTGEDIYEARLTRSEISELNTSLSKIRNALIAQSRSETRDKPDPDMVRTWKPIETMPKTGIYLVCQNDSVPTCINAKLYWEERPDTPKHLRFDHFTHWMPLPTPPINDVLNYKEGDDGI